MCGEPQVLVEDGIWRRPRFRFECIRQQESPAVACKADTPRRTGGKREPRRSQRIGKQHREVEGVRRLRFAQDGSLKDLGVFTLEGGLESGVGSVGVQP